MNEEVKNQLKAIRLPGLLANWDQYLAMADKENYSHTRLLKHIVGEEYRLRMENSRKMRICKAKIPEKYVIETFPFDKQPKLSKKN